MNSAAKLMAAIAMLGVVNTSAAYGQLFYSDYKARESDQFWMPYLAGMMEAWGWANASLAEVGSPMFFCYPSGARMTADAAIAILDAFAIGAPQDTDQLPVGLVLQMALQERFPC